MPTGVPILENKKEEELRKFSNCEAKIEEDGYIQYVLRNGRKIRPGDEVEYERNAIKGKAHIAEFIFNENLDGNINEVQVQFAENVPAAIRIQDMVVNLSEKRRGLERMRKNSSK